MTLATVFNWTAWNLDVFTWGWIVWMLFFVVWETAGIIVGPENTLTWHLRPLFVNQPLTWFMAFGLWLWIGFHFLLEVGNPLMGRG